jgi:hypothetical protein
LVMSSKINRVEYSEDGSILFHRNTSN